MKKFENIHFCEYSQTYRSFPENYWLASVKDGALVFDSWDRAKDSFKFCDELKKLHEKIKECKNIHSRLYKTENLIPVIVKTENSNELGVQFWTDWQIKNKVCRNTDNSNSYFVTLLK